MATWTRFVLRFRWWFLASWVVVAAAGFAADQRLAPLLSNQFTVPGTDSERVRDAMITHFGARGDGSFQIVFRVANARDPALRRRLSGVVVRAARVVRTGKPTPIIVASPRVVYGNVLT